VHTRVTRVPFLAATIGVIALLAAGCAASGNSASGLKAKPAAAASPQQALLLAAHNSEKVNSLAAKVDVVATSSRGDVHIAGDFTEQLHPSLLADADFTTFSDAGQSLPGGLSEILTSNAMYASGLGQALPGGKKWVEVPLKSLGAAGSEMSALLSQAQNESPVTQTELLAHSKTAHKVGTAVLDGVPVTEYAGTYSISQALAALPASTRSKISKDIATAGISNAQFKVWLDSQDLPRKIVVAETGTTINETITESVTRFNQPVHIQVPPAAQTFVLPSSALTGSLPA
jgi:hypothetical protein